MKARTTNCGASDWSRTAGCNRFQMVQFRKHGVSTLPCGMLFLNPCWCSVVGPGSRILHCKIYGVMTPGKAFGLPWQWHHKVEQVMLQFGTTSPCRCSCTVALTWNQLAMKRRLGITVCYWTNGLIWVYLCLIMDLTQKITLLLGIPALAACLFWVGSNRLVKTAMNFGGTWALRQRRCCWENVFLASSAWCEPLFPHLMKDGFTRRA